MRLPQNENNASWSTLLDKLQNQGIQQVSLVVTDGFKGLEEIINQAYPLAKQQRCLIHIRRNLASKVKRADRAVILEQFKTIYHAENLEIAVQALEDFIAGWEPLSLTPNNLNITFVIILNIHTIGLTINITNFIGLDTNTATFSELFAAIVFGVISPNINTNTVITAVANGTAPGLSPNIPINKDVDIDVAAILTTLFPTNIELNNLFGSSINSLTNLAPFTPSSFICLILILLKDINDVSDAEKKPEPISNTSKITI